jgi:hypothetical protein
MLSLLNLSPRFSLPPGGAETGTSLVWALNGTLMIAVAGALVWLWCFAFRRDIASANARLLRFLGSTPILAALTLGAIFNVSTATYLGYEIPRDILQDIVSAKLWLQGKPAFPLNMTAEVKDTIDHEPAPPSLARWSPALAEIERVSYHRLVTEPWAQAHPAGMTLLLALFVPWLHVRTIMLLFVLVSLVALIGTVRILRKGLGVPESQRLFLALTLGILGWFPFWMVLRNGQITFVLTFLVALALYFLQRERNVAAGVCLGVATGLKLFPGLLLVYLLIRKRKAFWPGALTAGALLTASFGLMGWHNTLDYLRVTRFVQDYYRSYRANLSMLAVFTGIAPLQHVARIAGAIFFVGMLGLLAWTVTRKSNGAAGSVTLNLEYAMFVALLPVLSPVSWDNYLVLLVVPVFVLISCLRTGSVFAGNRWWTSGSLCASLLLAVPQPFSAWGARMVGEYRQVFFFKMPVIAVFAVFAVLWGMRMQLAQPLDAKKSPTQEGQSDAGERPVAA